MKTFFQDTKQESTSGAAVSQKSKPSNESTKPKPSKAPSSTSPSPAVSTDAGYNDDIVVAMKEVGNTEAEILRDARDHACANEHQTFHQVILLCACMVSNAGSKTCLNFLHFDTLVVVFVCTDNFLKSSFWHTCSSGVSVYS